MLVLILSCLVSVITLSFTGNVRVYIRLKCRWQKLVLTVTETAAKAAENRRALIIIITIIIIQELCESRWPSWAVRLNEPYGFHGRKTIVEPLRCRSGIGFSHGACP